MDKQTSAQAARWIVPRDVVELPRQAVAGRFHGRGQHGLIHVNQQSFSGRIVAVWMKPF
jgi:hypothetical protein